jgi:hypothetical protein
MEFESPFFPMPITRSRVMLEAASEGASFILERALRIQTGFPEFTIFLPSSLHCF